MVRAKNCHGQKNKAHCGYSNPSLIRKKCRVLSFCLVLLFLLTSCVSISGQAKIRSSRESVTVWPKAYNDAIKDAINPEPGEIVDNLTPIVQDNPKLAWKVFDGIPHVLMISLVGDISYYKDSVGKRYNTMDYYIWVTAVPEIQKLCRKYDFAGNDLTMRLRQLIGLAPNAKVVAFVEFWVNPEHLFRPAADNEIDDTTAGLILPDNTESWYRKWFNELRAAQYFQSENPRHDAYPWTQLGYTYDWGNPDSEQGLSEFVIKTNSKVIINAIYAIDAYCN
ncbi:MAG: hypothetical protein Q7J27_04925 [Syntrophales bacterium]|nr:hypothetical protein [Syntrophales bacterium]